MTSWPNTSRRRTCSSVPAMSPLWEIGLGIWQTILLLLEHTRNVRRISKKSLIRSHLWDASVSSLHVRSVCQKKKTWDSLLSPEACLNIWWILRLMGALSRSLIGMAWMPCNGQFSITLHTCQKWSEQFLVFMFHAYQLSKRNMPPNYIRFHSECQALIAPCQLTSAKFLLRSGMQSGWWAKGGSPGDCRVPQWQLFSIRTWGELSFATGWGVCSSKRATAPTYFYRR